MMVAVMNRLLRPFGLKLGPLQAGAVYFPIAFPRGWHRSHAAHRPPGRGRVLARHRHPVRVPVAVSRALLAGAVAFTLRRRTAGARRCSRRRFPISVAGLLFSVKFAAALLGVWLMQCRRARADFLRATASRAVSSRPRRWCRRWCARSSRSACAATPAFGEPRLLARRCRTGGSATSSARSSSRRWCSPIGFHGVALAGSARGGRAATLSAFAVLLAMLLARCSCAAMARLTSPLDVPYIVYPVLVWIAMLSGPRRTALAAGITVAIASLATTRGFGTVRQPLSTADLSRAVRVAGAAAAGGDGRARTAPSRRRVPATSVIAPSSPTAPKRFSAPSSPSPCRSPCRPTIRSPGCANTATSPSATPHSWWRSASRTRRARWSARVSAIIPPGRRSISSASAKPFATATRCATSSTWCTDRTDSIACCSSR